LGRLGAQEHYPKYCSSLEYGPDCLPHKRNSAALIDLSYFPALLALAGKPQLAVKGFWRIVNLQG
jgi:hypothetical protein